MGNLGSDTCSHHRFEHSRKSESSQISCRFGKKLNDFSDVIYVIFQRDRQDFALMFHFVVEVLKTNGIDWNKIKLGEKFEKLYDLPRDRLHDQLTEHELELNFHTCAWKR